MNLSETFHAGSFINESLLADPSALNRHIETKLHQSVTPENFSGPSAADVRPSAVLLLLGSQCDAGDSSPCLILNRRSQKVRQPGDLCCPGGGITPLLDDGLARLLRMPGSPLTRWPYWSRWRREYPEQSRRMALMTAAGLREGFEEMRLNPFGVRLLGPLPPERLRIFRRVIYPVVGWVKRQKQFHTNWEVDDIVYIPLNRLLSPQYYGRYRITYPPGMENRLKKEWDDFPCFLFGRNGTRELLWGATYRIVMNFLKQVFGFEAPPPETLDAIEKTLEGAYLTGQRWQGKKKPNPAKKTDGAAGG